MFHLKSGLFHVDFFTCIISGDLHVDIKSSLGLIYFMCNPHCLYHVDHWCTFSNCFRIVSRGSMVYPFTSIADGYHVNNATLFCFTSCPRVFFTNIIGVPIHVYIM